MKGHGSKFGRKKEAAVAALLAARKPPKSWALTSVPSSAGCGCRNSSRKYRRARWEVVEQGYARAQQNTPAATSVLLMLMAAPSTPASSRIRAALGVFGIAREAWDLDIETRVAALERASEEAKGGR
jgi:hypothetical protein